MPGSLLGREIRRGDTRRLGDCHFAVVVGVAEGATYLVGVEGFDVRIALGSGEPVPVKARSLD